MAGNPSWRTPSAAQQSQFNLVPLPGDFEPTEEEESLLSMYEQVRAYERQAARIKEEAARAKLNAKDEEFKQRLEKKAKKVRKRKRETNIAAGGDDDEGSDDEEDVTSEEDENDELGARGSRQAKVEAKLQAWREEVEDAKQDKETALRDQLLTTTTADEGPAIVKKTLGGADDEPSLISNIKNTATPPHDFSQKLELKSWKGKTLYPTSTTNQGVGWHPVDTNTQAINDPLLEELENFDITQAQHGSGNNTLAIKFMAPSDSKRFSINITTEDNDNFQDVLFHFNPRQQKGGQLIMNDRKEGIWGHALSIPLSQIPLMFGQTACTLIVQINGEGFDVFLEGKHCARFEHRTEIPSNKSLVLQFPCTDDYGSPENWTVYKVWWGNKAIMAKGDLSGVPGVNIHKSFHPRKLFIRGLTRISTEAEVDIRRAELERAFRKYGGARGVTVLAPTHKTFAFVEMESETQAQLALDEMSGSYTLSRARRSRHEALMEERAAAEAAGSGKAKATSDWD